LDSDQKRMEIEQVTEGYVAIAPSLSEDVVSKKMKYSKYITSKSFLGWCIFQFVMLGGFFAYTNYSVRVKMGGLEEIEEIITNEPEFGLFFVDALLQSCEIMLLFSCLTLFVAILFANNERKKTDTTKE
jgi:hypothetical protein